MLIFVSLISFLTGVFSRVDSMTYKSCGTSTDIAQNIVLDISPKLPQTDYIFYLNGDFSKQVDNGTSRYDITYNFIPLSPTTNDLCIEINNSNITCPLNVGHISSESKGSVPTGLTGTTVIKNQWFDGSSARILCIQITIKTS
jgi:hypothetical protein